MKVLIIKIKDAGIFNDPLKSKTKDKVLDFNGKKERTDYKDVPTGTFFYKNVANLLRVLFGERPVPTFRKVNSVFIGDAYYEELAKKCRVNIDTAIYDIDKVHDKPYYGEECFTANRSYESYGKPFKLFTLDNENVFVKGGSISKDRLRRYLGSMYNEYVMLVDSLGGAETAKDGIELLNKNKTSKNVVNFCEKCLENKLTLFVNVINNKQDKGAPRKQIAFDIHARRINNNILNLLFVSKTVEKIKKVSGTLYVPVTDEDIEKVKNSTGVASFLEGGVATVEEISDWNDMFLDYNEIFC
jgi:hypothetical protein